MAGPNYVLDKSWIPTGAVRQFRTVGLVTTDKDKCAETSALGAEAIGICQNEITAGDATLGRMADVRVMGISRAVAGAVIAIGDRLRADAQGRLVPLAAGTTNQNQVAVALTAAAAIGDHIEALLTPGSRASTV